MKTERLKYSPVGLLISLPAHPGEQVVLVLDTREQFSRSMGGHRFSSRNDSLEECVRTLQNQGINAMVSFLLVLIASVFTTDDNCQRKSSTSA